MTAHLDIDRSRALLAEAQLDGLLALTLDNIQYLTGYRPLHAGVSGGSALLNADGGRVLVVGGWEAGRARAEATAQAVFATPTWIEVDERAELEARRTIVRPKPVQLDLTAATGVLAQAAAVVGIGSGRIGVELAALTVTDARALASALPGVELVDAAALFHDLRAIKTPAEVDLIRRAARLADDGLAAVLEAGVRGRTVHELRTRFSAAIWERALKDPASSGLTALRGDFTTGGEVAPSELVDATIVADGHTVFVDYGAALHGYGSDSGRSFSVGAPAETSARIFRALLAGHAAAEPLLRAGTPISEVFSAAQGAVREAGLPTYTRGHVGHGAGLGLDEQGPFVSPHEHRLLQAGMVICLETPYYVRGLGGHQIEDMYVITDDGAERLTPRPRDLLEI